MTGATFDRGRYESAVSRVGNLLGDLWAVDEALEYCQELACRGPFGDAREDVTRVRVTLGTTHPFEEWVLVPVQPGSRGPMGPGAHQESVERHVRDLRAEGAALGDQVTAYLRESFRDIVRPVPEAFKEAADIVTDDVAEPLARRVPDDFAELANNLGNWRGQGAERFADTFYNPVQQCVTNQVVLAEAVRFGLAGSKAIVHQGQHSVMGLVLSAEQVLEDQLAARQAEHAPTETSPSDWLALAATLALIAAAVPTAGASLAAAGVAVASASGSLLSYASTQVADKELQTFSAMSASDAQDQLLTGVDKIRQNYRQLWSALEDQLGTLRSLATTTEREQLLYPRRPRFAADGTEEFRHESAPR